MTSDERCLRSLLRECLNDLLKQRMKSLIEATKFIFLFIIAVMAYLAYAIYGEYYQGVRAAESYKYARLVAVSMANYFSNNFNYSSRLDDLGLHESESPYVGDIRIDDKSGIVSIYLAGNSMDEGVLVFTPKVANDGSVEYACQSVDVPNKYIPNECLTKGNVSDPASRSASHDGG